jgi:hypothetical protein
LFEKRLSIDFAFYNIYWKLNIIKI